MKLGAIKPIAATDGLSANEFFKLVGASPTQPKTTTRENAKQRVLEALKNATTKTEARQGQLFN